MVKGKKTYYKKSYYNYYNKYKFFRYAIRNYGYKRIVFNDTLRGTTQAVGFVTQNSPNLSISTWLNNADQWTSMAKQYLSWKLLAIKIEVTPSVISDTFSTNGNEFITLNAVLDLGDKNDYLRSKNCLVLDRYNKNSKYISMRGSQSGWMDTAQVDDVAGAFRTGSSGTITSGQIDYTVRIIFYCMFKNPD